MKKIIIFGFLLAIPGILFGWMSSQKMQFPDGAQAALSDYIMHRNAILGVNISAEEMIRAEFPWNFSEEMSGSTYGNSVHFLTDVDDGNEAYGDNRLTFPPRELWCVRISSPGGNELVFVGLHETIYISDWVIHERGFLGEEGFSNLGCELSQGVTN